jgi:dolichol-phosphate mannosyltransferase
MMPPNTPAATTLKNANRNAVRDGRIGVESSDRGGGPSASSTEAMVMATAMADPAWQTTNDDGHVPVASPAMRTLVVLPTYNESENLELVLTRIRTASPETEVLVVDDGSPDGTAELAADLAKRLGRIQVLRRSCKSGLGSAYRAGFRVGLATGYDTVVEMDADLSHDPASLPDLLAAVERGADLAIGSRYVKGGSIPDWPASRRAISRIGCTYARAMLRLPVHDATSGFRAYRASVLRAIDLSSVRADGYGFQIEMAYRVAGMGGRIVEVPIEFRDRRLGASKMSSRIVAEALYLVTLWGLRDRFAKTTGRRRAARAR